MGVDVVMVATTPVEFTEEQVRQWSYQLCTVFGSSHFWQRDDDRMTQHALEVGEYGGGDDGWSMHIEKGVPAIWVNMHSRLYRDGYERGDWLLIHGVATWLKKMIPQATVWYGGDSDSELRPFDDVVDSCWNCFVKSGTKAYFDYFRKDVVSPIPLPPCEFCGVDMEFDSGSTKFARFHCDGCGKKVVYNEGVWIVEHDPVHDIYQKTS